MRLPLMPGPADVRSIIDELLGAGPRVLRMIGAAEALMADAAALIARMEETRARADEVVAATDETRQAADVALRALQPVTTRAEDLIGQVEPLLAAAVPSLTRLLPVLDRLAETTDPREVDALVALVDNLPLLAARMETDIMPVLETLATVAPDLHDLLDVSRELNEMLGKLPGMRGIKKRVEEEQEAEADQ